VKVLRGIRELVRPDAGSALAIGTFDGVHLGHRTLIGDTIEDARSRDLVSGVVTWDRHPAVTVRPPSVPALLTSLERRLELFAELGLDLVAVITFDEDFGAWSPERFVDEVLVDGLAARSVHVGFDWRFGRKASGDADLLARLGAARGFEAHPARLASSAEAPITSTRIRAAVRDGEMELAAALLGRSFDVDGMVVRGDGRGATLGYPTANLDIDPALVRPAQGVYAGRIRVRDTWYRAAVNVGKNLTFGGEVVRVEAFILDFDDDIYGETLRLEFWHRLRDELKFDSVEDLIRQMDDDVAQTRSRVSLSVL
jgi:riboflavin kinase / FMN adenylyltransferase